MPNPLTLEIRITNKDGKVLVDVGKQIDDLSKKTETVSTKSQNFGREFQRGFSIAQSSLDIFAPTLSKLNPQFDTAIRGAQQLSGVVSLGLGFGPLGVVVAGVTAALGLYVDQITKADRAIQAAQAPYEKYIAGVQDLARGLSASGKAIADNLHVTDLQAASWDRAAQKSAWLATQLVELARIESEMAAAGERVKQAQERLMAATVSANGADTAAYRAAQKAYQDALDVLTHLSAQHDIEVGALDREADAAGRDAVALWGLTSGYDAAERARAGYNALVVTGAQDLMTEAQAAQITTNALKKTGEGLRVYVNGSWQYAADQTTSRLKTWVQGVQSFTKTTNQAAEVWDNLVKSMAQGLLTPTGVTGEDVVATKGGTYKDKWDEYARRMKDIEALGTKSPWTKLAPPNILAQGSAALQAWAAAEDKAFYAGQRMTQVNTSAWLGDVNAKIDETIGQWELMNQAQAAVTTALKKMQVDDPLKYNKFLQANNLPVTTSAEKAAKAVTGLGTDLSNLPATTTTTIDTQWSAAKQAISDAHQWLQDKILQYSDIEIDITAQFHTPPPSPADRAGLSPMNYSLNQGFQHGGVGIFQRTGPVYVHAGEPYWIGGTHGETPFPGGGVTVVVNFSYQPYLSLADRYEVEDRIAPLVADEVARRLRRGGRAA